MWNVCALEHAQRNMDFVCVCVCERQNQSPRNAVIVLSCIVDDGNRKRF